MAFVSESDHRCESDGRRPRVKKVRARKGRLKGGRPAILKRHGFASYEGYLQSGTWKSIRSRVFRLKGIHCVCCESMAEQVHHSEYTAENMFNVSDSAIRETLFPVCDDCHRIVHFGHCSFRSQAQARAILKQMIESKKKVGK